MIDFEISSSGDLVFEKYDTPQDFKLSFRIAESKGINIKFHIAEQKEYIPNAPFKLSFVTKQKTRTSHSASLVSETNQKLQRIKIALETERGELSERSLVGSRLSTIRHEDLYDRDNLNAIEEYVNESIEGILSSPTVLAKPERGIGHFYAQTVGIYIYEKDILIFKFFI